MINPRVILAVGDLTSLQTIPRVCESVRFRDRSLFIAREGGGGSEDLGGGSLDLDKTRQDTLLFRVLYSPMYIDFIQII